MNKGLNGLKWHDGEYLITELSFLGEFLICSEEMYSIYCSQHLKWIITFHQSCSKTIEQHPFWFWKTFLIHFERWLLYIHFIHVFSLANCLAWKHS